MTQAEIAYKLDEVAPASVAARAPRSSSRLGQASLGLLLPALTLVAWSLAAKNEWVPPQLLPAPALVGETLVGLVTSGELVTNLGISLLRIAGGFALGGLIGLGVGVLMGLSRRAEDYIYPTFQALNQVPVLGWLPLAMMVFGIGESLKIVIIAQASLVPVAVNAHRGIRGVPKHYIEVARVLKFSRAQLLAKVVFPAAVPSLFVGARYGLTLAWLSLVTVELLASSEGLGFMIVWGRQLFQLDLVLAAIIAVGLVGLALDKGLAWVEARLLHWRPDPALELRGGAR